MKILLLTPIPPDRGAPGAIPAMLHAELTGLAERNDVTLVTPAGPDPVELAAVDRLGTAGTQIHSVHRHMDPRRWARRARMSRAWLRGQLPWRTVWFHEPTLQPLLDQLLADHHFDVVAVQDNSMAMYQLNTTAATILTEHEARRPRSMQWQPGPPRQWPAWAFGEADYRRWPRYQRAAWSRFDAVQVFTERDAQTVSELAPELRPRVHVAPFGIELPLMTSDVPVDSNAIAFLGNYTHPPNVDAARWLARDVLPRVRRHVPTAHLRLAGIHAPSAVRALASSSVEIVGVVDDADAFLRRHAVVAAPVR
ncbi:MAG: polysaccharide biosynthesis protein PslH, partial [Acidimicrobiaceae bacterium]